MRVDTWVIRMTRKGWWGTYRIYYAAAPREFTFAKGSADRFESENAARHVGYELKDAGICVDFDVEHIPADPARRAGIQGTGGPA